MNTAVYSPFKVSITRTQQGVISLLNQWYNLSLMHLSFQYGNTKMYLIVWEIQRKT